MMIIIPGRHHYTKSGISTVRNFKTIYETAVILHPGKNIEEHLPAMTSNKELSNRHDAWYLSNMSRRIFRAGLRHSMVDAKWPDFEAAFFDFQPDRVRAMSDEDLDALMQDRRLIRHWAKIKSVRANAEVMYEQAMDGEGFGAYLAEWPICDIVNLWEDLRKRFAQMGGQSAPYFLRMVGKDTFILTQDVIRALNRWGAWQGKPNSIKAREKVQGAFNEWQAECGRPLCQISRILAFSVVE
jgi:3-methyladenine DNA glycosylase Tag